MTDPFAAAFARLEQAMADDDQPERLVRLRRHDAHLAQVVAALDVADPSRDTGLVDEALAWAAVRPAASFTAGDVLADLWAWASGRGRTA
jgi:hypothetical protein